MVITLSRVDVVLESRLRRPVHLPAHRKLLAQLTAVDGQSIPAQRPVGPDDEKIAGWVRQWERPGRGTREIELHRVRLERDRDDEHDEEDEKDVDERCGVDLAQGMERFSTRGSIHCRLLRYVTISH